LTPGLSLQQPCSGSESTHLPASVQMTRVAGCIALDMFNVERNPMLEAVLPLFSIQKLRAARIRGQLPMLKYNEKCVMFRSIAPI
jgi:hypothetical protein